MADIPSSHVVRNCLLFAYRGLRNTERLVEGSLKSPYEELITEAANALSPNKKLELNILNSEVEAFYNRRLSEKDFMVNFQSKILSKIPSSGPGTVVLTGSGGPTACGPATVVNTFNQFSLLFTVVWELLSSQNSAVCNKLPKHSGRQLWEVFLKLDTECLLKVHVDDIVDLILRIFQANGHHEQEENVKEWFCGEAFIDFWVFFSQLTEKFVGLLQVHIVQEIHTAVVSELLKEGKMDKKGHVVHNWKTRWFVLTASSLSYFETRENLVLKGCVVINSKALVQNMQEYKARPNRFRVVCGETKNGTEISAPSSRSMHDWIYTIRLAIKMHNINGRNFLHKYRQALVAVPKPHGLAKCMSEDKGLDNGHSSPHKKLNPTRSVPLDPHIASPTQEEKSIPPVRGGKMAPISGSISNPDYEDPDGPSYHDPPLVPPQRFDSKDAKSKPEVFDKAAFNQARKKSQKGAYDRTKRHSSLEPGEVEHLESTLGGIYAVVNKSPSKKNDVSDLLSPTVRAQLPLDATDQIQTWGEGSHEDKQELEGNRGPGENRERKDREEDLNPGYIRLDFHRDNTQFKGKAASESSPVPRGRVDPGKTKFGYSTVVFEKETAAELIEKKKHKPPPQPPPRYGGSGSAMSKNTSDSALIFSDIDHQNKMRSKHGASSPDITPQSDDSGYVNVRHNQGPPIVPPRRGAAAISESPELPKKTS